MYPALSRELVGDALHPMGPYPNPLPPDFSRISPLLWGTPARHFAAWRAPGLGHP